MTDRDHSLDHRIEWEETNSSLTVSCTCGGFTATIDLSAPLQPNLTAFGLLGKDAADHIRDTTRTRITGTHPCRECGRLADECHVEGCPAEDWVRREEAISNGRS